MSSAARMLGRLCVAIVAVVVTVGGVARAQPSPRGRLEANSYFERGNRLYQRGQYPEAVTELKAGYALDPRPEFLYALGQAERKRGDCKAAIAYYQAFVDSGPSPQRTVAVLVQIDRCKQELTAAAPAAPPVVEPLVAPPAPAPAIAPAPAPAGVASAQAAPERKPLYRRWWLWTVVGGVVVVGAGVGVAVALASQRSSFNGTLPDLVIGKAALVRF